MYRVFASVTAVCVLSSLYFVPRMQRLELLQRLPFLWRRLLGRKIEEETLPYYTPFRYHPVSIGDCFNQRYEVASKLGYGVFSTVWFAKDKK